LFQAEDMLFSFYATGILYQDKHISQIWKKNPKTFSTKQTVKQLFSGTSSFYNGSFLQDSALLSSLLQYLSLFYLTAVPLSSLIFSGQGGAIAGHQIIIK